MRKYKTKCKICKKGFDKISLSHVVCSCPCAIEYEKRKKEKKTTKRKYTKLEDKSHSDLTQLLQKWFNKFIRLRDAFNNGYFKCINCEKIKLISKMDAGHYLAVSNYPSVRFNEDNVNSQCSYCNRMSESGHLFYRKNLIKKIGLDRVKRVEMLGQIPKKHTKHELLELIKIYKKKCKELE